MSVLSGLMRFSWIGGALLNYFKRNALKPLRLSSKEIMKRQERLLSKKFNALERTDIGRKLGVRKGCRIKDLPVTSYDFYKPFFDNPIPSAFMYPLNDYQRTRTSATSGAPKWFMIPKKKIDNIRKTMLTSFLTFSYNDGKFLMDYGDTVYINVAPYPYAGGIVLSEGDESPGILRIVPNLNLPYQDKVEYFIRNYDKIDSAAMLAASLVSKIIPAVKKRLKLKGLGVFDTVVAETYYDEIETFAGTPPRTVYTSTETLIPCIPSVQHRLSFIMDWRCGFFEFIPVSDGQKDEHPVDINEVKLKGIYRVIYTSFFDELTRYDTKDSFECVALSDDILGIEAPVFKFYSRMDKAIDIQRFTRIDESELLKAMRDAHVPFVDFTARKEVVEGMEYLTIYLEYSGNQNPEVIRSRIHNVLYSMDMDYKNLTDYFDYVPLRIVRVPEGTFTAYLEQKEAAVPKVERINMSQEKFNVLLEIMGNDAT